MAEFFGDGVSRTLSAKARQFVNIVWQRGKPPLDSEFNLLTQLVEEARQSIVSENVSSGWIGNTVDAMSDFEFERQASNMFWLGKNRANSEGDIIWANVNGWLVPVVGTNSADTQNAIMLPPPQGAASDSDVNFVFLEVWKAQISPDGDVNKPSESLLYKYGNVEYGGTNIENDLLDPQILIETTERVQLQYRLRVVNSVNPALNPHGFGPSIKAQGTLDNPTTNTNPVYEFTNMRDELGDPGLWRSGDGDGETGLLGTVDGYVYAVPLCFVFRRTVLSWTKTQQHGAVNRYPGMTDRSEARVLPTITLTTDIGPTTTVLTVDTTQSATTLSSGGGYVRIGAEILSYSDYTGTTITISERGAKGTYATNHDTGETVDFVTGHPLGLFSDEIISDDVLDLRHIISMDGLDYNSILNHNFRRLVKGELATTWKKSGADVKGRKHFQIDYFGGNSVAPDFTIKADAPDGFRRVFSDASTLQPDNLMVLGESRTTSTSSDFTLNASAEIDRRDTGGSDWYENDVIRVGLDQFRNTFPFANAQERRKVRFVHPFEYDKEAHDPVRIWFGDTDPASGISGKQAPLTLKSSDTDPWFMVLGKEVGDLATATSGTADLTFTTAGTIDIAGVDFSTIQTGTTTVGDYLASIDAWIVITGGADAADVQEQNHGLYKITANSGTALTVETAAGGTPSFTNDTANREWGLHLPECTEHDEDLIIGLVKGGQVGDAVSLNMTYDLLYHPARGLSRNPENSLYVELDPGVGANYVRENDFQNIADSPSPTVKKSPVVPLTAYPHRHGQFKTRDPQDITKQEGVWSEAYVGQGSKTLLYQPLRNVTVRMDLNDNPGALPYSDVTGLFNTTLGAADSSVLVPKEVRPPLGRLDLPFVTSKASVSSTSTAPAYGFNCCFLSGSPDLNTDNFLVQRMLAVYDPVNTSPSDFGTYPSLFAVGGGPGTEEALVCRYYNKGGVRGIEIPAHYGVSRLFAIYRQSDFYNTSPGNSNFAGPQFRVDSGVDRPNLLRENGERRSLIITDNNTFVIPEDIIDQTYFSDELVDEPLIFEFASFFFSDWGTDLMRIHRTTTASSPANNFRMFVNGPAESGDEFFLVSTRTPYQGSIYGTMPVSTSDTSSVAYTDYDPKRNTEDPVDILDLFTSFDNANNARVSNPGSLEILSAIPFATTLGTGVIAGEVVAGSYTDVGYLSLESYPFTGSMDPARPVYTRAHAYKGDGEAIAPSLAGIMSGITERLPLGLVIGDYQFLGEGLGGEYKRFWSPAVSLESSVDYRFDKALSKSLLEGTLVFSDGTSSLEYEPVHNLYRTHRGGVVMVGSGSNPGGAFVLSGGRVYKDFPYLNSPDAQILKMHGAVLFGVAFLVRNREETVTDDNLKASFGDELQMVVATGVTLGQELDLSGDYVKEFVDLLIQMHPRGIGEGYCAADRFRVEGRPLQKRTRNKQGVEDVDVFLGRDPSGKIALPSSDGHC